MTRHDARSIHTTALFLIVSFLVPATASAQDAEPSPPAGDQTKAPDSKPKPAQERSPWEYGGDFGLPTVSVEKLSVLISGDLGYRGETFGLGGAFDFDNYSFAEENTFAFAETNRTSFELDAYYNVTSLDSMTLDVVADASARFYSTFNVEDMDTSDKPDTSQDSEITRFHLAAGLRSPEDQALKYTYTLGVGLHFESFGMSVEQQNGEFESSDTFSEAVFYQGTADISYALLGRLLTTRAQARFTYYNLSRSDFVISSDPNVESGFSDFDKEFTNLEFTSKLTGGIPLLAFLGLKPGVYVGLDIFSTSSSEENKMDVIPSIGLGLSSE